MGSLKALGGPAFLLLYTTWQTMSLPLQRDKLLLTWGVIPSSFCFYLFRALGASRGCVTNELGALVMTHYPPVYIVQMLPTSSLPN